MNGGTFVGPGSSSNMTKAMSTTATQANMLLSSTTYGYNSGGTFSATGATARKSGTLLTSSTVNIISF